MVRKLPFMRPLLSTVAFSVLAAPGIIRETLLDSAGAAVTGVPCANASHFRLVCRYAACAETAARRYSAGSEGRPAKSHFDHPNPNRFTNYGVRRRFLV